MEPCELTAREARRLIGAKALSPVELLQSCFARIDAVNRQVNGVVAQDRERARAEARAAEQAVVHGRSLGALHGLPIGIKDMLDTAGLRTTYGSPVFKDQVPGEDADVVRRLRAAGAIVQFKTNTPEWAVGANTFNPVYGVSSNPFAPELTCGGSSGGSAIVLATDMLPLAHGSDNAGSLRIPAAFNGVVGLRPTGAQAALSVEGPMARDVGDLALLLHEDLHPADLSRLRVAFSADLGGFAPLDAHIRRTFERHVAELAPRFLHSDDACFDLRDADFAYKTRRAAAFVATWRERMQAMPEKWGRFVTRNYEAGLKLGSADIERAEARAGEIQRAAARFFERHDLLVTPTCSVSPWPKHELFPKSVGGRETPDYFDWVRLTYGITLINHPAMSIPCGLDERGLPFGLQVVAGRGKDAFLLQAAMALEAVLPPRPRPNLATLAAMPAEDPLARLPG